MRRNLPILLAASPLALLLALLAAAPAAAQPPIEQALKLAPIQPGVDYDSPTAEQAPKCTVEAETKPGFAGWIVRGPAGEMLRRFVDSNGDKRIDLWCYYKNGVEVYRDIDSDFNGKADQYRWFSTAGTRWGIDRNEDGAIDYWKIISAEEVSYELVEAIKLRDAARFRRLLLTSEELDALGFDGETRKKLTEQLADAAKGFEQFARTQQEVARDSVWIHFAAAPPGTAPAGTDGLTKDVTAYENASAMLETAGKHGQLAIGTLVQVPGGWRLLDLPAQQPGYQLFLAARSQPVQPHLPDAAVLGEEERKLIAQNDELDKSIAAATTNAQRMELTGKKADVLWSLARNTKNAEMQANWVRQYADTLHLAAQSGYYPKAAERIKQMFDRVAEHRAQSDLAGYVKFRYLSSRYSEQLQGADADLAKVQDDWLKELEAYVEEFPQSQDAAEAMLQLALAREFAGQDDGAKRWYGRIMSDFADLSLAAKAKGAIARLDSVGKALPLAGTILDGRPLNLNQYRGKVVLLHYWATWCQPCKQDMERLKQLLAEFGDKGFALVGVNLDNEKAPAQQYVNASRLPWPHLWEEGGLDSRLANELGVLTLPTMILLDEQGRVIDRNAQVEEVKKELQKRLTK